MIAEKPPLAIDSLGGQVHEVEFGDLGPDGRSVLAGKNWPATRWVNPHNKPRRVGDYFPVLV